MVKKQVINRRIFPLIQQSVDRHNAGLFDNPDIYGFKTPADIQDNLKHTLRSYQNEALFNLNWTQLDEQVNDKYNQLLFNMATGSGKTDVMASIILYMYSQFGYQNFLFVANSNSVINKTKENFLNEASNKYLFKQPIVVNGSNITIHEVEQFSKHYDETSIYLKITTIQALSNELGSYYENGLTYEDLARNKMIILADEAHHFNTSTKKERKEENSWENLLDKVRISHPANRQFEFTATIDLDKDTVYNKYKDKIIYKYELNRFMNDGYSKNVMRLESNQNDINKMLNAVLLSQYRKRIAKDNGIENFKPVILFKSNTINYSIKSKDKFLNLIDNLSAEYLQKFMSNSVENVQSTTLLDTYHYWLEQDLNDAVIELKRDFQKLTIINVNDSGRKSLLDDKADYKNLNTLEDANNPLRVIFAVAKLTEGWDVLNLYDIVRLGEKVSTTKETNQEAQLVGRGARYYPFKYDNSSSFTRRFDNDLGSHLSLLETLFYHTINDVNYLKRLRDSFDEMNLVSSSDNGRKYNIYTAKVKEKFKKTEFYKYGNLYHNQLKDVSDEEFNDIKRYGINSNEIIINMNQLVQENDIDSESLLSNNTEERVVAKFNRKSDQRLIKKALSRVKFFRFDSLKQYIPAISSIEDFLHSDNWLGNLSVKAIVSYGSRELNIDERCNAVRRAFEQIRDKIKKNYRKKRGTSKFIPIAVKDVIIDYQKRVLDKNNLTGNNSVHIEPHLMNKDDWFIYDYAIVDKLEFQFIEMIRSFIEDSNLKDNYSNIYLLRVEEQLQRFKLYEYNPRSENHYEAYMPDFILCMNDGEFNYQIFAEPKGNNLVYKDQWKQDFLENLDPEQITIIGENDKIRLLGVPFYTNDFGKRDIYGTEKALRCKLNVKDRDILS